MAPTCIPLAAVARQAQHAHGVKAVAAHKLAGGARGAVARAVVHHNHLPREVSALAVAPPLQVAAAQHGVVAKAGVITAGATEQHSDWPCLDGAAACVRSCCGCPRLAALRRLPERLGERGGQAVLLVVGGDDDGQVLGGLAKHAGAGHLCGVVCMGGGGGWVVEVSRGSTRMSGSQCAAFDTPAAAGVAEAECEKGGRALQWQQQGHARAAPA